jgi:hypothetical protein
MGSLEVVETRFAVAKAATDDEVAPVRRHRILHDT